jgi:hypothetical protein
MKQSYEALAESLREQAGRCVKFARRSNSLRDIVRLIATASTLEHAARKLCSTTDVNLSDIAQKLNAGASLATACCLLPAEMQSTCAASPIEAVDPITSRTVDAKQTNIGGVTNTHKSVARYPGDNKPMWKLIAMLSRPGGES